jgi:hypothetical protein
MTIFPTGGIAGQMLPQGMNGIGAALGAASPLLMAMSSGLLSGQGAMSQMPMGLLMMQQQAKQKKEEDAKTAAAGAYGSWQGGTMASGIPAALGASNTPPPPTGPLAGAMRAPERFSPAPSNARMDEVFAQTEQQYRLPAGYLARTAQIESGGNPNAQNPNSSAGGLFQFIDSTAAQYGVNKMDPASATEGAARLAADNAAHLRQALGREPSAGELYLAHQQGAGGAAKLLLNPDAKAADIVGTEAVRLNGGDPATWTAGDFARRWQGEYGETQIADPASDPQVQGMIGWLAQYGEVDPSRAAAVKMQLEMRIQQLQAQSEGQGLTDAQAAQFGLQEAGQQPGPLSPQDRFQNVPGVGLVDLYAEGGPKPVLVGEQEPLSGAGKLLADLKAGRITQEQFDAELLRGNLSLTTDAEGNTTLTMGGGQRMKPLTEGQSKDNFYLTALEHAGPILDQYEAALTGVSAVGNEIAGMVPFGEFAQSPEYQQAQQAVAEWGAPVLRKESGAALTKEDYKWLTSRYIPVAGDKPEVVAQKRQARRAAEAGIRSGMTDEQVKSVAKAIQSLRPGMTPEQANSIAQETAGYPGAPKVGAANEGHRYAGGDPNDPASWVK